MKSLLLLTVLVACFSFNAKAQENKDPKFMLGNIYLLDDQFSHHVVVVEKSTHALYVYKNINGTPQLVKRFASATGKFRGNKSIQGDRKTPEGIYTLNQFYSKEKLNSKYGDYGKIYGAGAFTTNYPNVMDARKGKTGGGIWLHSTDDNTRVSKGLDSKGCVVVVDDDLREISQYIDLKNTPIVIVQNLTYLKKATWLKNKGNLVDFVNNWANAWKEKDFKTYMNSYSKRDFFSSTKGDYNNYRRYKRAVFARKDKPQIGFSNINILKQANYVVVQLQQDYNSSAIQDIGKKTLYLQQDKDYNWKIIHEGWSKIDNTQEILAFVPSMRFFKENKKKQ
jgi:murein L,D-transpeptidase YafK